MNNLEIIINVIPLLSGIYSLFLCLTINTSNFTSDVLCKVIPFFLGLGCVFSSLKLFGVI